MEEEWNNLFLHSFHYTVKTYFYTIYYTVKVYFTLIITPLKLIITLFFYTIKTYCYTLFYTLFLSFTPLNYTLICNSTLNKGGTNGVKILFLHSLHSFPRYISVKSSARKPSRKHAVVWWDALNESINIFSYSSVGNISIWFKKINSWDFSIMVWVCFPPPYLNRAGDRLRRIYVHSTIGDFWAKNWPKNLA